MDLQHIFIYNSFEDQTIMLYVFVELFIYYQLCFTQTLIWYLYFQIHYYISDRVFVKVSHHQKIQRCSFLCFNKKPMASLHRTVSCHRILMASLHHTVSCHGILIGMLFWCLRPNIYSFDPMVYALNLRVSSYPSTSSN